MKTKTQIRAYITSYKEGLTKINSSISSEDESRRNLKNASSKVGSAYGGEPGRNLYDRIQEKISDSYNLSESLSNVKRTIKSAINEYEDEYNKLKKE